MFTIEQGIPVASDRRGRPSLSPKFPLAEMKVGDSFFIPMDSKNEIAIFKRITVAASRYSRKNPPNKFTIRKLEKDNGARCWRIA